MMPHHIAKPNSSAVKWSAVAVVGICMALEFVQLDAATWSTIDTVACWLGGGLVVIGFVALMVRYPRLATAIQTVMLVLIAMATIADLGKRDR